MEDDEETSYVESSRISIDEDRGGHHKHNMPRNSLYNKIVG